MCRVYIALLVALSTLTENQYTDFVNMKVYKSSKLFWHGLYLKYWCLFSASPRSAARSPVSGDDIRERLNPDSTGSTFTTASPRVLRRRLRNNFPSISESSDFQTSDDEAFSLVSDSQQSSSLVSDSHHDSNMTSADESAFAITGRQSRCSDEDGTSTKKKLATFV